MAAKKIFAFGTVKIFGLDVEVDLTNDDDIVSLKPTLPFKELELNLFFI